MSIGFYGCTITALCSLLDYYGYDETPKTVNQKLTDNGGYAYGTALLIWTAVPRIWPHVKFIKRVAGSYNNVEVAWWVYVKSTPVMVEVNAASIGATRHWVLYIGDRKAMDPWTGIIVPTNKYPAIGYSI